MKYKKAIEGMWDDVINCEQNLKCLCGLAFPDGFLLHPQIQDLTKKKEINEKYFLHFFNFHSLLIIIIN